MGNSASGSAGPTLVVSPPQHRDVYSIADSRIVKVQLSRSLGVPLIEDRPSRRLASLKVLGSPVVPGSPGPNGANKRNDRPEPSPLVSSEVLNPTLPAATVQTSPHEPRSAPASPTSGVHGAGGRGSGRSTTTESVPQAAVEAAGFALHTVSGGLTSTGLLAGGGEDYGTSSGTLLSRTAALSELSRFPDEMQRVVDEVLRRDSQSSNFPTGLPTFAGAALSPSKLQMVLTPRDLHPRPSSPVKLPLISAKSSSLGPSGSTATPTDVSETQKVQPQAKMGNASQASKVKGIFISEKSSSFAQLPRSLISATEQQPAAGHNNNSVTFGAAPPTSAASTSALPPVDDPPRRKSINTPNFGAAVAGQAAGSPPLGELHRGSRSASRIHVDNTPIDRSTSNLSSWNGSASRRGDSHVRRSLAQSLLAPAPLQNGQLGAVDDSYTIQSAKAVLRKHRQHTGEKLLSSRNFASGSTARASPKKLGVRVLDRVEAPFSPLTQYSTSHSTTAVTTPDETPRGADGAVRQASFYSAFPQRPQASPRPTFQRKLDLDEPSQPIKSETSFTLNSQRDGSPYGERPPFVLAPMAKSNAHSSIGSDGVVPGGSFRAHSPDKQSSSPLDGGGDAEPWTPRSDGSDYEEDEAERRARHRHKLLIRLQLECKSSRSASGKGRSMGSNNLNSTLLDGINSGSMTTRQTGAAASTSTAEPGLPAVSAGSAPAGWSGIGSQGLSSTLMKNSVPSGLGNTGAVDASGRQLDGADASGSKPRSGWWMGVGSGGWGEEQNDDWYYKLLAQTKAEGDDDD